MWICGPIDLRNEGFLTRMYKSVQAMQIGRSPSISREIPSTTEVHFPLTKEKVADFKFLLEMEYTYWEALDATFGTQEDKHLVSRAFLDRYEILNKEPENLLSEEADPEEKGEAGDDSNQPESENNEDPDYIVNPEPQPEPNPATPVKWKIVHPASFTASASKTHGRESKASKN